MNEKALSEEIKNLKVNLSKQADSFNFLKEYLIDKGVVDKADFELGLHELLESTYSITGELIIEEYNLCV